MLRSTTTITRAIGLDQEVIDRYFTNTVCRIGGISLADIEKEVDDLHSMAFDPLGLETDLTLDSPGHHKMRSGGDDHLYNPATIHTLQEATRRGDYELFKQYTTMVNAEDGVRNLHGKRGGRREKPARPDGFQISEKGRSA